MAAHERNPTPQIELRVQFSGVGFSSRQYELSFRPGLQDVECTSLVFVSSEESIVIESALSMLRLVRFAPLEALLEEKLTPGLQHRILKALEHTAWPIEIFKVLVAQIERGLAYNDVSTNTGFN
jgi:hypothetical protein